MAPTEITTIRRAGSADISKLTELMQASRAYLGPYRSIISGYRMTEEYVASNWVYIAVDENRRTLGFYSLIDDPPELDLMFVSDEAQGRGVGKQLVQHLKYQARRLGLVSVRVVSHPPAEQFYLTMGARRIGTVPPQPPRVSWERPELQFAIVSGETVGN